MRRGEALRRGLTLTRCTPRSRRDAEIALRTWSVVTIRVLGRAWAPLGLNLLPSLWPVSPPGIEQGDGAGFHGQPLGQDPHPSWGPSMLSLL